MHVEGQIKTIDNLLYTRLWSNITHQEFKTSTTTCTRITSQIYLTVCISQAESAHLCNIQNQTHLYNVYIYTLPAGPVAMSVPQVGVVINTD